MGSSPDQMLFIILSCVLVGDLDGLSVKLESSRLLLPQCGFERSQSSMAGMGPWDREAVALTGAPPGLSASTWSGARSPAVPALLTAPPPTPSAPGPSSSPYPRPL